MEVALDRSGKAALEAEGLEALAVEISEGIALCRAGRIDWASPRLAEIFGHTSVDDLIDVPLARFLVDLGEGMPGNGQVGAWRCGVVGLTDLGRTVRVVCRALDGMGKSRELFILREETQAAKVQSELLRVSRALRDSNSELATLREQASRTVSERRDLFNIVSHELRTPVTVISGYHRLLLSGEGGELTERQRGFLSSSDESCRRLDDFIGSLLDASHEGTVEHSLNTAVCSIHQTIADVSRFLEPLVAERGLRLDQEFDEKAGWAHFDATRIEQVLTNLMNNAIRYATEGGDISVATRRLIVSGREVVEVAVEDDGPGVSVADRERIFEPYVRASSESGAGGLGLGLAISKRIVAAHGGCMAVTDARRGGSRFTFTLPAADQAQEAS